MNDISVQKFISNSRWIFAKTAARRNPHEYTLKREAPSRKAFVAFVVHIREHGYEELFHGKPYTMLNVDGFKYWTMGAPVEETILINRKPLGQDERFISPQLEFDNLDEE